MNRTLSAMLFVVALHFVAVPAHAGSSEKRDAALRLVETLGVVDLNHLVTQTFMSSLQNTMRDQDPSASTQKIEVAREELMLALSNNQATLIEMFVEMYERNFSLSEIQDMNRFYRSSTGRKLIEVSPVLNKECLELSQSMAAIVLNDAMPNIKRRLLQERVH